MLSVKSLKHNFDILIMLNEDGSTNLPYDLRHNVF